MSHPEGKEVWRSYPHNDDYLVSSFGRIRGPRKLLSPILNDRYLKVCIGHHNLRYIHVLVLETFVGERPDGMVARHLDGDTSNNQLKNLCWGTPTENMADRERHGNHLISGVRKLSVSDVQFIRSKEGTAFSRKELASLYGVNPRTIKDVLDFRTFTYVEGSSH
jgi:hypothetical protein